MPNIVYLATPYSHENPKVSEYRFHRINQVAAKLMNYGFHIYSPISHTHPIAQDGDLPKGWDYWEKYDAELLKCCNLMMVLKADGWEESVGVKAEINLAIQKGIPIVYLDKNFGVEVKPDDQKQFNF